MKRLKKIWLWVKPVVRNKYILTIIIFFFWVSIFDTYSLIDRIKDVKYLKELQKERSFFKEEILKYRKQLRQLESSKESLEKFAREQHLMKSENEDVFIILGIEEEEE